MGLIGIHWNYTLYIKNEYEVEFLYVCKAACSLGLHCLHHSVFICMNWLMCVCMVYGDEGNRVVTKETHMFVGD